MAYEIQMAHDNHVIKNDPKVRERYPALYAAVVSHDRVSQSSWYTLSDEAFRQYQAYCEEEI